MKILQISHNYHVVGGSDAVFFATCNLLSQAGHEVIPFCQKNPDNMATPWDRYFPKGANHQSGSIPNAIRYFYNPDARNQLVRLLDDVRDIDVAHLHIYHGKQTPAILSVLRARGIPVVHTLHEYKLACPVYTMQRDGKPCDLCIAGTALNCVRHRCKDNSVIRSALMAAEMMTARILGDVRLVDRFICVSDFQRQIMRRAGIPADKMVTMHNFVDVPNTARRGDDGYYLFFGRIEKLKGIPTLIEAFRRSGRQLLIAGDGSWRGPMHAAIGQCKNIRYLGFKDGAALNSLISRARAVIVPSEWYENCPMSVLEAKALGRPVIGAKIGGIPELVQDRIDGILFEPASVDDLIAALGFIEQADQNRLYEAAISDAKIRFSRKTHLASLLGHYQAVLAISEARFQRHIDPDNVSMT